MSEGDPGSAPFLDAALKAALVRHLEQCGASDAALLERVRCRVMDVVRQGAPMVKDCASLGGWEKLLPGVERKILHRDGNVHSFFIRCSPGASVPGHLHTRDEECLVLEGSIRIGDVRLQAGDYHRASGATRHGDAHTESGVLMFVRGALGTA